MIKAVIFDIDGVLLDSFEANLKFFQDLMVRFEYPPPTRKVYQPLFHLSMRTVIEKLTLLSSEEEIEKIWNVGRRREVPYPEKLLSTPDGMEEILKSLYDHYVLGIATSRVKEVVFDSPQLGQFEKYFSAVAAYQDTERHKPDPDPILFAAKQLGVRPEESVYIGDVENDIIAARAAGMKVIIYSKNQFDMADACTAMFRDLPKIIQSL
ncbi:MAG: HAD family hydrolase [bacterium]|nr:HAD family hydrolase [bacterium]